MDSPWSIKSILKQFQFIGCISTGSPIERGAPNYDWDCNEMEVEPASLEWFKIHQWVLNMWRNIYVGRGPFESLLTAMLMSGRRLQLATMSILSSKWNKSFVRSLMLCEMSWNDIIITDSNLFLTYNFLNKLAMYYTTLNMKGMDMYVTRRVWLCTWSELFMLPDMRQPMLDDIPVYSVSSDIL